MGAYNTVSFKSTHAGEEYEGFAEIQFKSGECTLADYAIGDKIDLWDGIHFAHEGAFVVFAGVIVAAFDERAPFLFNKWGGKVQYPELNR